jgi:hypothetical protein
LCDELPDSQHWVDGEFSSIVGSTFAISGREKARSCCEAVRCIAGSGRLEASCRYDLRYRLAKAALALCIGMYAIDRTWRKDTRGVKKARAASFGDRGVGWRQRAAGRFDAPERKGP